ncbi:transcriptional regulator [Candidatus Poribacteria bacterium]|nr:transcriptional regulator [Candidatus Poribacteria bacterium]
MAIKPIKNNRDYEKTLERIEEIWDAKKNTHEGDELEILSLLVENYEQHNYSMLPPDPIEAIKFRIEQMGLKRSDLIPYFGGQNRVSEVLNRKRHLTVKMIKQLYQNLNIPVESLIG